jgi:hypothetical protein
MKTFYGFLTSAIMIFVIVSCTAGSKAVSYNSAIVPLSDTVTFTEGCVIYGLPRTVFTIKVDMERKIEIPGPYARYAADFLGITDAITEENESWTITGITVGTHEEIDPSEYYVIYHSTKSNSFFGSNALSLRKEGLILDINPRQFFTTERQAVGDGQESDMFRFADLGSDEYFNIQKDTVYQRVNIDSAFIRVPYIVESRRRLTQDQLAENAARRIIELRDGKHLVLTGETNVFPQSDAAINEINRMEKEYTELFAGKVVKENRSYTVTFIPEPEMENKSVTLFRFSELTGPITGSASGGVAITAELIPEQKTKALTIINNNRKPGSVTFDKLFYRAPDIENLRISMGREVLKKKKKMVYQFGEIVQLPANFIISK